MFTFIQLSGLGRIHLITRFFAFLFLKTFPITCWFWDGCANFFLRSEITLFFIFVFNKWFIFLFILRLVIFCLFFGDWEMSLFKCSKWFDNFFSFDFSSLYLFVVSLLFACEFNLFLFKSRSFSFLTIIFDRLFVWLLLIFALKIKG